MMTHHLIALGGDTGQWGRALTVAEGRIMT